MLLSIICLYMNLCIAISILENEAEVKEIELRNLERIRFRNVTKQLNIQGYSVKGFYHVSKWRKYWNEVMEEQLEILDGRRNTFYSSMNSESNYEDKHWTRLLKVADSIELHIAGSESDYTAVKNFVNSLELKSASKLKLFRHNTIKRLPTKAEINAAIQKYPDVTSGEVPTINALHNYCKAEKAANRKALVFYIHNKGGCCSKSSNGPVSNWRDLMNTWILEFPSICLRALMKGYNACGINYQAAHYSGNFWWANCDYVADIPALADAFDAYEAEFFIFKANITGNISRDTFARNCMYNPFHCKVDHYHDRCPRSKYIPHILQSIKQDELPPNPTATQNPLYSYIQDYC